MLNMVWKSTESFGNLSLKKYGILKWKMCRNPTEIIDEEFLFQICDNVLNLNSYVY